MELLCGRCSQDKGFPLDERMKLAKSRLPNVIYICPVCVQEHSYKGIGVKAPPIESPKEIEQKTTKSIKKTKDDGQLSLF
ncbi:hypothetical protein ABLT31_22375 [Ammoniphilus sp. 3BR4]